QKDSSVATLSQNDKVMLPLSQNDKGGAVPFAPCHASRTPCHSERSEESVPLARHVILNEVKNLFLLQQKDSSVATALSE
ncbi:MAG: hypothetical protein RR900_04820, partial [Ruthenibacterium sp.]